MGITVGGGRKSSRGRRGVPRYGAMADINMTPFIDVMLVLLIIFMVAAPLLTTGRIGRPAAGERRRRSTSRRSRSRSRSTIRASSIVMDQPIADADLVPKLQAASQNDAEQRIYLRASKVVPYGRVAQIMASVTQAGFKKVALVTEPTSQ